MKLVNLTTQHPGGWASIISFLGDPLVPLLKFEYSIKRESRMVGTRADPRAKVDLVAERVASRPEVIHMSSIEGRISGVLAADALRYLMAEGWPVPGDSQWLLPCSKWKRKS